MNIIIGNSFAFLASIVMASSGIVKEKKKILYVQSVQTILFIISNIVLKGISGFIINVISFIRNVLCYKDKLDFKAKIIITILASFLTLCFNNVGIIGLLPLISMVLYLWLMTTKDVIKFKMLIIITMVLWAIYDFRIQSYVSVIFDIITIITNIIDIINTHKTSNPK